LREKMMGVVAVAGFAPSTRSSARTRIPPNPCSGSAASAAATRSGGTCSSAVESFFHSAWVITTVPFAHPGVVVLGTQSAQAT
jgi:hypothetical protein